MFSRESFQRFSPGQHWGIQENCLNTVSQERVIKERFDNCPSQRPSAQDNLLSPLSQCILDGRLQILPFCRAKMREAGWGAFVTSVGDCQQVQTQSRERLTCS